MEQIQHLQVSTDEGHIAFDQIKISLNDARDRTKTAIASLNAAQVDGLSEMRVVEARAYLTSLLNGINSQISLHLKTHEGLQKGISEAPTGSPFSGRKPT